MILSVGVDISISTSKDERQSWEVGRMTTMSFLPSRQFLESAVQQDDVRDYLTSTMFRDRIYMITGVMVAEGTMALRERMQEKGLYVHAGVDATAWTGVPISAGPEGEWKSRERVFEKSQREEEFVFAFRVREVRVKKGGVKADRTYDRGALFSREKQRVVKEADEVEVVGLEDDADVGEFELESKEVVQEFGDEEEEECVCVMPELQ
jgi:hypothetical protein